MRFIVLFFLALSEQWWRNKDFSVNVPAFLQIVATTKKLVVFYFLECFSPLIGFINIYTLSTNRNKYNKHCCRMSTFSIRIEMLSWQESFHFDSILQLDFDFQVQKLDIEREKLIFLKFQLIVLNQKGTKTPSECFIFLFSCDSSGT